MINTKSFIPFLFVCWLPFAIFLSIINLRSAWHVYNRFHGKTDSERLKLISGDVFPTLKICRDLTPENAKILIVAFPFEENALLEYHLYPRLIYRGGGEEILGISNYCKARRIGYYIVYDNNKNPVLTKVE